MHQIELLVYQFLEKVKKGEAQIDAELFSKFGQDSVDILKKQFEEPKKEFTLRMSNIGKPICQLQYEQAGVQGDFISSDIVRFTYGDIAEKLLTFIMYAAKVPIVSEQEKVSVEIGGIKIDGTLDFIIDFGNDPRVWDVKSASEWSFKNKFNKTFEEFIKDDFYGYAEQLFLYAEAKRCKVGGWIAFDKSSGQIKVVSSPNEQSVLRKTILGRIEDKIARLNKQRRIFSGNASPSNDGTEDIHNNNINKQFAGKPELFRTKPTGNVLAPIVCTMCPWKLKCWPDIQLKPKAKSQAKDPPLQWYLSYKEEEREYEQLL